jgi:tetratricopeptide (TPR) repeat protein
LNVSAFLFGAPEMAHTDQAYTEAIDLHGPDDISVLARSVAEEMPKLSFDAILALLRTTGWDTDYLMRSVPRLIEVLPTAEERLRHEVPPGIQLAWDQYYPIGESEDVPFGLGALLYTLEHYSEALEFFEISLRDFGEDPRTTINLALTCYRLGHLQESLHWVERTLALDPDHELARNMRPDILADLAQRA